MKGLSLPSLMGTGLSWLLLICLAGCASLGPRGAAGDSGARSAAASEDEGSANPTSASSSPSDMAPGSDSLSLSRASADSGVASAESLSAPASKAKSTSTSAPVPAPPEEEPLIMERADRMEGFRDRGEYVLSGGVVFTHGGLRLETQRAVWRREASVVICDSGMVITNRGARLTARGGQYNKTMNRATAEGNVVMKDSAGEFELTGRSLIYNRLNHIAQLFGDPVMKRFPEIDSAAGGERRGDTLVIKGDVLSYNDSLDVARAEGNVRIARGGLLIVSNRAEFHRSRDSLLLTGEPKVKLDENEVAGKEIGVRLAGEEIRSLMVRGNADAQSVEKDSTDVPVRKSRVWGDSLFMTFKKNSPDSIEVFSNTKGNYFDVDRPDYVNEMTGGYMVLRFGEKRVTSAHVVGEANSVYYHFEKNVFKGRNAAKGDTIQFTFDKGKIDEVEVIGKAAGQYLAKERGDAEDASARRREEGGDGVGN